MTTFQLLLLIVSGVVFYLFYKQLMSGSYPKRGVDFEAKVDDAQVGGISRPDKTFSKPTINLGRVEELHQHADEAIQNEDYEEAKKALGSALVLDRENAETLYKMAYIHLSMKEFNEAKQTLQTLIALDDTHDMGHAMLANVLHSLQEDDLAVAHHLRAIELDRDYAPHYFNYANTLYDIGRKEEAYNAYEKAYTLDETLSTAKEMIEKLSKEG